MGTRPLVLVSGKDVLEGVGGHESYVRAHALAAAGLGFAPHVFCVGARSGQTATEFGVVHHVAAPGPVVAQVPWLSRAVVRFLAGRPGPHGIHGFALWAAAGALAARTPSRGGTGAIAIASAYGTRAYEVGAMQAGLHDHHGRLHRVRCGAWLRWIRAVDDPVERWGYANSRAVLVNYESVAGILRAAYGPGLRVRRVPYTVADAFLDHDAQAAEPLLWPTAGSAEPDAPLVLAVSRHDPRKGLDVLLLALADLAARGVPFRACLIGPGRLLDAHRRLAAELGIGDRVAVPGRVEDVRPYFASADVFVLPSLAEASGSVSIVEALRCGTAVTASACDGIPEDLEHGTDALLVAPGDVSVLAGALRTLLSDPDLRARLGAGGRRAYEQRFSASGFADMLGSVYGELGITASATSAA